MPKLELYYKPTCPYCQKVMRFMNQNGITLTMHNTLEGNNRDKLVEIGGMPQVPCLVIDGRAMYESDDIIEWLKENGAPGK